MRRLVSPGLAATLIALLLAGGTTAAAGAAPAQADPSTVLTFLAGLPVDREKLDAAARQVSTPGERDFRRYRTVDEAAREFGATTQAERRLVAAARSAGLSARIDRTRTLAQLSGTVQAWESLMGAPVQYIAATAGSAQLPGNPPIAKYRFAGATPVGLAPAPAPLASHVTWFLPTFHAYVPQLDVPGISPIPPEAPPLPFAPNNGTSLGQTCLPDSASVGWLTPAQASQAYGLTALQREAARTKPIVTVLDLGGGFSPADLELGADCFGYTAPKVDVRLGTGMPSPFVSILSETSLDLQTVAWALKEAPVVRLVQVLSTSSAYIEAFAMGIGGWSTPPDSMSMSYSACELQPEAGAGSLEAMETLLRFAAVVGISVFNSAGDRGSSVCQSLGTQPSNPRATINYPGSSWFMTAVGGTQLNLGAGNARVGESVWNDLQYGLTGNAASTGGASVLFNAPWYQRPRTWSDVRTVPDLAAQAGFAPAIPRFYGGTIGTAGGTSQASPIVASGFALLSAHLRAQGKAPMGFVNPWLYRTAHRAPEAFYDVTVGTTQYPVVVGPGQVTRPACCQAQPGFDTASGFGAPLFDRLLPYAYPGGR